MSTDVTRPPSPGGPASTSVHSSVAGASAPTSADGWVTLAGLPTPPAPISTDGWVALADLRARDALHADLAALAAERDALAQEVADLSAIRSAAAEQARDEALAATAGELRSAIVRLATAQRQIAASGAAALALVARDVVASLLRQTLAVDHDALVSWIRDTLASRPGAGALRLRVHPDHVASLAPASPCPVQPDPRLGHGDAIVELPDGQLDLRLDHLAAALAPTVEAALGHLPSPGSAHGAPPDLTVDTSVETSLDDVLSLTVCTDPTPTRAPDAE